MLLKDGEPTTIPAEFLKKFVKPIVYRLTKDQTPIDHRTGKRKTPRSFMPPTEYSYFDNTKRKVVSFRFAENVSRHMHGAIVNEIFTPSRIPFRNGQVVCDPTKDSHIELAYWLSTHPRNMSSDFYDSSKPAWFEVENKEAEAKERNSKRSARAKAEHLIYEQWGANEIREICRAFDITKVDDKSIDELQDALSNMMDKDPISFMKRSEDEQMVLRAKISQGRELNVLTFDNKNSRWMWGPMSDREEVEIVKVRNGEDAKTRLIQHWNRVAKEENLEYFYDQLNVILEKHKADREARLIKRGKKKEESAQSAE